MPVPHRIPESIILETRRDFSSFLNSYVLTLAHYSPEMKHVVRTIHQDFHRGKAVVTTLLELRQSLDHPSFQSLEMDYQRFLDALHHFTSVVEAFLFRNLEAGHMLDTAMIVGLRFPERMETVSS